MAGDEAPRLIFQDLARSIDVWLAPLANDPSGRTDSEAWLSPSEHQRVAGKISASVVRKLGGGASDRRRRSRKASFYVCQRRILASYLDQAPADVRIERDRRGKPFVPGGRLSFNASDANLGDQAFGVVAVHKPPTGAPVYDLGVDIEADGPRALSAWLALTAGSPSEQGELLWQPKGELHSAITNLWTRKEAVVKATGVGLAAMRATVTESARNPGERKVVRSWRWVGGKPVGQVRSLPRDETPAGFSVAVAWKFRSSRTGGIGT